MRKIKIDVVVSDDKFQDFQAALKLLDSSIVGFIRFGKDHTVEIHVKNESELTAKEVFHIAKEALKFEKITLKKILPIVDTEDCFVIRQTENQISVFTKNKSKTLSQLKKQLPNFKEVK